MKSRSLNGGLAITAFALAQTALGDDADEPKFAPPGIVRISDEIIGCMAQPAQDAGSKTEINLSLTIAANGRVKKSSLADGSPAWMTDLSTCALKKLEFRHGTLDGKPEQWDATLTLELVVKRVDAQATVSIGKVGPLVTAPRSMRKGRFYNCPSYDWPDAASVAGFVATMTVFPDGSFTDIKLPVGSKPWQERLAHCLISAKSYFPGTKDGVPIESEYSTFISKVNDAGHYSMPKPRSSSEELEAAYRDCYPLDLFTMTSAFYSFTVSTDGKVNNPKVVKGTGDPRLDQAGVCILQKLEFTPSMQNGRAKYSNVTWELPLRPPR